MNIKVYVSDIMCISKELVQFRFPKRKSKRIRKKWTKNSANYRLIEKHRAVLYEGKMYMSEKLFSQYKNVIDKQQNVGKNEH